MNLNQECNTTVRKLAQKLGVSVQWIHKAIKSGRIPFKKIEQFNVYLVPKSLSRKDLHIKK